MTFLTGSLGSREMAERPVEPFERLSFGRGDKAGGGLHAVGGLHDLGHGCAERPTLQADSMNAHSSAPALGDGADHGGPFRRMPG